MKLTFPNYCQKASQDFYAAVANIFMVLPHFFSVRQLVRTLFVPWKNLQVAKSTPGFSFHEWTSRISFNLTSSAIGFGLRTSILTGYVITISLFTLLLPFLIAIHYLLLPISYLIHQSSESEAEHKKRLRQFFVRDRVIDPRYTRQVSQWFEIYYDHYLRKRQWWSLANLMTTPPLARDWNMGFTPTLDKFARQIDIPSGHSYHFIGREHEITQIEQILAKNGENNVLLVGEEGVGRHTIITALGQRMDMGICNPTLVYKRILQLNMEAILSTHTDFAQRELLFSSLLKEAQQAGNVIIFIDELHRYVSTDPGHIDLSSSLATFCRSDKLQIIGVSTPFLFEKFIHPNEKIRLLFEKVDVLEIAKEQALAILMEHIFALENRFHLSITYDALVEAVDKSEYYLTDTPFPQKAINLLDQVCAYTIQVKKTQKVLAEYVDEIVTLKTHIPVTINDSLRAKLLTIEEQLKSEVIAQDEGVHKLAVSLRQSFVVSGHRPKPLASLLILGPTGVGKTQTAKAIAKIFFDKNTLVRLDMSFYQNKTDIAKLTGADNEPGILTTAIRENPYGVLLLDEIEKAHPDLLNIFLTILDEGYFIDGLGKRVDCKNLIIIATSNAAADYIYGNLGATVPAEGNLDYSKELIDHLIREKLFTPEFLNRFDAVVAYRPLTPEAILAVATKILSRVVQDVYDKYKIRITVSQNRLSSLVARGYSREFGARQIERVIREEIDDVIAQKILKREVTPGQTVAF